MITFEVNYGKLRGGARLPKNVFSNLEKILKRMFPKSGDWEISVAFLTKAEIKKINQAYRGKDEPTDVLSFAHTDEGVLGEVLICYDLAKAQAKEQGVSNKEEVVRLLIHGVLHLMGYDHIKSQEAEEMFALQEVVLNKVSL